MKSAEPQLNIEVIVGTILAVCFSAFVGYMIGIDHVDTVQKLELQKYKAIASQPCVRASQIKSIVYPYCKNVRRVME